MTAPNVVPRSERAVCVTGMHRSGTSFTARALQLLGASLGASESLMAPGPDNPAGYWENRDVKELNDEVLARLGGTWDVPPVLEPGWEHDESLDPLRARASAVLDAAFGAMRSSSGVIAWKDPRLSLLLPFWRTVMPIAATMVVVRDPREVAASLRTRNGIDLPQAMVLWLRYLYAGTANDPGHLLVRDRDFFVDLPGTLSRMAAHVGLPPPTKEVTDDANAHLDPSLRHHVAESDGRVNENPLVAMASMVWNEGSIDLECFPSAVTDAIRFGWMRPPIDGELLARARAEVVTMRDQIRQRRRQERAAQSAGHGGAAEKSSPPVVVGSPPRSVEDGDE
jgi:hypothetical protein